MNDYAKGAFETLARVQGISGVLWLSLRSIPSLLV